MMPHLLHALEDAYSMTLEAVYSMRSHSVACRALYPCEETKLVVHDESLGLSLCAQPSCCTEVVDAKSAKNAWDVHVLRSHYVD